MQGYEQGRGRDLRASPAAGRSIAFISDFPPSLNFSGGLFAGQVMRAMGSALDRAFIIQAPSARPEIDPAFDPNVFRLKTVEKPAEFHSSLCDVSTFAAEQAVVTTDIPRLVADIVEFAAGLDDPALWVVLEGQTLIRVAYELLQETDLPMIVQVMDPPEWWLRAHNVDQRSQGEVLSKFRAVLRGADGLAATSWAMAAHYGERFGVPAAAVVPSLPTHAAQPACDAIRKNGAFVIGFAGQIYASEEWRSLVGALDEVGWRLAGREVRIQAHVAETSLPAAIGGQRVALKPWAPQEDLVRELAQCDLLYCPYWFDPNFEIECRLCFPSKLTSYLATGRPVLFHGPAYASPGAFLAQADAGFMCNSLEAEAVRAVIAEAINDPARYAAVARNGRAAFDQSLTMERLEQAVATLSATVGERARRRTDG